MRASRNLKFLAAALAFVVGLGTVGFHYIEGWPWFDGFYMVITTLTTIGYEEVHPLSHAGRVFNIVIILSGVSLLFLLIGSLTQALLEFELQSFFGRRRMERDIDRLTGHYIICGAGRVGRSAARELARRPAQFVIIENNEAKAQKFAGENWLVMVGDATQEQTLRDAQIERAAGLVAATTTDATNLYIVLTARSLNPKLRIIARASEDMAEKHLRSAGADAVVCPYVFAGQRIAHSFLRPHVVSFWTRLPRISAWIWKSAKCRSRRAVRLPARRLRTRAFAKTAASLFSRSSATRGCGLILRPTIVLKPAIF